MMNLNQVLESMKLCVTDMNKKTEKRKTVSVFINGIDSKLTFERESFNPKTSFCIKALQN